MHCKAGMPATEKMEQKDKQPKPIAEGGGSSEMIRSEEEEERRE